MNNYDDNCNYQFYLYKNYAYNKNWNLGYSKTFNKLLSFILCDHTTKTM